MAVKSGPDTVTDGLEMHLDAGDKVSYPGSGATWSDLSGNQKHYSITFDGGGEFKTAHGGYIYFGGGTGNSGALYVDINKTPFNVATSTATMSFWRRKKETSPHGSDHFTMDRDNANGVRIYQSGGSNNPIVFATNSQSDALAGSALTDNLWYHVVCTLASTSKKIYINGFLNASSTVSATTISRSSSGECTLGSLATIQNTYNFAGDFGPVIFYNKALSAAEVSQNFNAQRGRFGI